MSLNSEYIEDMSDSTKVQVAYVHSNTVGHNFYHSMMSLDMTDIMPNHISARSNSMGLVDARNNLTEYFLDKTDATHLWWIDSDMGFAPDTPQRLLKHGLDAVGARTYGYGTYGPDGMGGFITKPYLVAYDLVQREDGFLHFTPLEDTQEDSYKKDLETQIDTSDTSDTSDLIVWQTKDPKDITSNQEYGRGGKNLNQESEHNGALVQVAGTGTGCLLLSRKALESVRNEFGDAWFDQVSYPAQGSKKPMRISEDLSFCYRLGVVGIGVFIDLDVRTNHMKSIWVSGS